MNPKIIYGTAWKKETTTKLVVQAILNGFRATDTACQPKHYREDLVGGALQILQEKHGVNREDLFVQTKYTPISGQDRSQPLPYDPTSPTVAQIRTSVRTSLSNLQTTYLDSYLLHSPLSTLHHTLQAWRTLAELQDEGTVRMIGVSNAYDVGLLRALGEVRQVQVVQNRWYEGNEWDREVCEYCRKNGIQYQSFWTLSGSPSLLSCAPLRTLAAKGGCTPAQAVFRLVQIHGIIPLSGTTNDVHMREDVAVEKLEFGENVRGDVDAVAKIVWGR